MLISCPHCGATAEDDGRLAGQMVTCHQCRQSYRAPVQAVEIPRPQIVAAPASSSARSRRGDAAAATTNRLLGWILLILFGLLVLGVAREYRYHAGQQRLKEAEQQYREAMQEILR